MSVCTHRFNCNSDRLSTPRSPSFSVSSVVPLPSPRLRPLARPSVDRPIITARELLGSRLFSQLRKRGWLASARASRGFISRRTVDRHGCRYRGARATTEGGKFCPPSFCRRNQESSLPICSPERWEVTSPRIGRLTGTVRDNRGDCNLAQVSSPASPRRNLSISLHLAILCMVTSLSRLRCFLSPLALSSVSLPRSA